MKRNARSAYAVLRKAGLTLMENNWSDHAHFEIAFEDSHVLLPMLERKSKNRRAKVYWADYWGETASYLGSDDLNELLSKHGLYFEWINAAVAGVYDA